MPVFLAGHAVRSTSRQVYVTLSKHVVRHVGKVPLRELTPAMVRTFAQTIEASELAPGTVQKVMSVLKLMCDMAIIDGAMDTNPAASIKAGSRGTSEMRVLSRDEYARPADSVQPHYRLLIETLVSTGMRWGECIAVKADAVIKIGKTWVRPGQADLRGDRPQAGPAGVRQDRQRHPEHLDTGEPCPAPPGCRWPGRVRLPPDPWGVPRPGQVAVDLPGGLPPGGNHRSPGPRPPSYPRDMAPCRGRPADHRPRPDGPREDRDHVAVPPPVAQPG